MEGCFLTLPPVVLLKLSLPGPAESQLWNLENNQVGAVDSAGQRERERLAEERTRQELGNPGKGKKKSPVTHRVPSADLRRIYTYILKRHQFWGALKRRSQVLPASFPPPRQKKGEDASFVLKRRRAGFDLEE